MTGRCWLSRASGRVMGSVLSPLVVTDGSSASSQRTSCCTWRLFLRNRSKSGSDPYFINMRRVNDTSSAGRDVRRRAPRSGVLAAALFCSSISSRGKK